MRMAGLIPALIAFETASSRVDAWGRLIELSPSGAKMTTQSELREGDAVELSFQVAGESFRMPARVSWSELDADGYWSGEIRFYDEIKKRSLAQTLLDVISRQAP